MKIGTRSVLFGAHCLFIHPWFVALAWWKLYGFPSDPRLWVAFFVHDLGYWGKPNMDGEEGEAHVYWGATFMSRWFDCTPWSRGLAVWLERQFGEPPGCRSWWAFCVYHSRFIAKQYNRPHSQLCVADKLAVCIEPWWFYLPRVWLSGELAEYRGIVETKYSNELRDNTTARSWHRSMVSCLLNWVEAHKNGEQDTWTPGRVA